MTDRLGRTTGPAGYEFGNAHKLPEHLKNNELFQSLSWQLAMEVLRGSFVISSGRQYAQLCDMAVAAALVQEWRIEFDRTIFEKPEAIEAIRAWGLAPSHTGRPKHTPGLIAGGHEFWWRMLGDAFAWQFDASAQLLPDERAIVERFRECGVGRGTSSTTTEELAALNQAIDDLRGAKGEVSDQLAARALKWHLQAELHWLLHRRPRTDHGDIHESRWRSGMIAAVVTSAAERTLYDEVLIREVNALDEMLATHSEQLAANGLDSTRELYDEVLEAYNRVHPTAQLTTLHHRDAVEKAGAPGVNTALLGAE